MESLNPMAVENGTIEGTLASASMANMAVAGRPSPSPPFPLPC